MWKKSIRWIALLGIFIITACGPADETLEPESGTSSSEVVETESYLAEFEQQYENSSAQYEAGQLDEAAGTIDTLLQNDLSDYPELEEKANALKSEINVAQAEKAMANAHAELIENSAYKAERSSDLAASEFAEATGKDIQTATDDEIEAWLNEKEAAESEAETGTESDDSSSDSSEQESPMTAEEERNFVLDEVVRITGHSPEENQFFASKIDEDTYQVEIRFAHEVEGVEISNMMGMFRYHLSSQELEQMDPLTGEYAPYAGHLQEI